MAATRTSVPPASAPQRVERQAVSSPPTPARTVSGPVRLGRRTKLLVKHLARGEIAVIDHLDIDRVSAEELIAAGAVAVLNCSPSSGGSYPNLGPQLLVEAGILLLDLPEDSLFDTLSDGDTVLVRASGAPEGRTGPARGEVLRSGHVLARGDVLDLARICAETEARRSEIGEALERFAHNTIEHMREERELLAGRIELPRFAELGACKVDGCRGLPHGVFLPNGRCLLSGRTADPWQVRSPDSIIYAALRVPRGCRS